MRWMTSRMAWLAGMLWFAACLWFFSRHNQFPIYYHPDEASKGAQIVSGALNFHHPLLLLDSIRAALWLENAPITVENAVFAGRRVSAIFCAASVVILAALAGRRVGWLGAILAGLLLPLHPLIYELAHYCKEDPCLLLGFSLTLLLLDVFLTKPSVKTAAWLGAAGGLAASGKYPGIVMLVLALPLVWWRWRKGTLACFGGFLIVVLLVNLPYLLHPSALQNAIGYEIHSAALGGQKGLSRDIPHAKYVGVFLNNIGWPLWIGLGVFALRCWRKTEHRAADLLLLLFPLGYTLLLSFSPKTASRYFLAASPLLIVAGSIGIVWIKALWAPVPRWVIPLGLVGAVFVQVDLLSPYLQGFRKDSRREMVEWIGLHLPLGSRLLAETRTRLWKQPSWRNAGTWEYVSLQEELFAPDRGTISDLAHQGFGYVAVIRTSFGGYLDEKRKPSPGQAAQYQQRAEFYRELFAHGKLLHQTGGGEPAILNPEIRLYDLGGSLGRLQD